MSSRTRALIPDFLEEEVVIRGTTFRLRELSIGDYDDLVKKATTSKANPLTGEDEERVDNSLLLKLMVMKACVEPRLTPEVMAALPMRVTLKLNQTVNRMHYGDEPASEKKEGEEEPEEEAKGND